LWLRKCRHARIHLKQTQQISAGGTCQTLPGAARCCRVLPGAVHGAVHFGQCHNSGCPGSGWWFGAAARMRKEWTGRSHDFPSHTARSTQHGACLPTCPVSELPAVRNLNDCAALSLLDSSSLVPPPPPSHSIPLHPPSSAVGGGHQQPRRPQHPGTPACDPCSQHAVRSGIWPAASPI